MEDALKDMWRSVVAIAPKLAAFIVILVIGWIVAKLIGKAVDKILERIGFDRAVERGGIKKALERSKYDASTIVGKIVYYALLLFVLQLAFGVFGPNPVSGLLTGVIAFLPRLFVALIIIVVASAIAAAVRDILSNTLSGLSYGRMVATLASVFILGLGIIAALNQVGIALTVTLPVLIAILGTIGGILVVGVGGGLIKPMQQRWENYLTTAEREGRNFRQRGVSGPTTPADVAEPGPAYPAAESGYLQGTHEQPQPPYPGRANPPSQQPQHAAPTSSSYEQRSAYSGGQPPAQGVNNPPGAVHRRATGVQGVDEYRESGAHGG